MIIYESEIEHIVLDFLHNEYGYTIQYGPGLTEGDCPERISTEVTLQNRLRSAIDRLNLNYVTFA